MSKSELELKMMGKVASAKYLSDEIPMDKTISEMVKDANLNPHQVARICETANISTYDELFKKHANGKFTFDLANQDKIAEEVNKPMSMPFNEQDATVESIEDLLPPIEEVESEESLEKDAQYQKIASIIEKDANKVSPTKIRKLISKLGMYKTELENTLFEADIKVKEAEEVLTQSMKTAALRGENIAQVYIAARSLYPEKEAQVKELFSRISDRLNKHNISIKEAARVYNEDAQGQATTTLINKNHPIIKHIDTILTTGDEVYDPCSKTKDYIVSKIEVLSDALLNKKYRNSEE